MSSFVLSEKVTKQVSSTVLFIQYTNMKLTVILPIDLI